MWNIAGDCSACIGIRCVGDVGIIIAVVAVGHAHGLLHVETAAFLLHPDGDAVPLQAHEFWGQSDVVGREADGGRCGISHTHVFPIAVVETVVVGHDETRVTDGDADNVAECESCLRHVSFCDIQHGSAEIVIGRDDAFQHRLVDGGVIVGA